tara:strand:+ start:930 stop:1754 length:825 start_codon:yes stop_codon:yes gene_type:complete
MTNSAKHIEIGDIKIGNDLPFALIAGPCQIESMDHSLFMAEKIAESCRKAGVQFIYKSSFDKANRSSVSSKRGVGIDDGLEILAAVKAQFGCSVLTDVHDAYQCAKTAEVVDVLQIPAFLCRQTDLLLAAANTGAAINVKKGQFLAPWDMKNVAEKLASTGNERIMLCERGTSFGYNTLVSDFRSLPVMAETGYPVVFDATHSVQQPGGLGATTGGDRKYVPVLAKAAVAVGCAMLFIETHEDPDNAPSDGPNMVPINELEGLLTMLKNIEAVC